MSATIAIAGRLKEVLLDGHWIANTNYKEQLSAVSWQQSIQKVADLNTIAALAYHINYYLQGLNKVFEEGKLEISDKYSFDLPTLHNEADWERLRQQLFSNSQKFIHHVEQMPEQQLHAAFVDEKYGSWLRNLEGVIEHCYYHLGQISLIRKLLGQ